LLRVHAHALAIILSIWPAWIAPTIVTSSSIEVRIWTVWAVWIVSWAMRVREEVGPITSSVVIV
jgi:hypothetical protein